MAIVHVYGIVKGFNVCIQRFRVQCSQNSLISLNKNSTPLKYFQNGPLIYYLSPLIVSLQLVSLTCRHTKSGEDYKGTLSTTYSGKTCQRWDSQSPHTHSFVPSDFIEETSLTGINNYCRNPDGEKGVWCYTTDADMEWEHCVVPVCTGKCICICICRYQALSDIKHNYYNIMSFLSYSSLIEGVLANE